MPTELNFFFNVPPQLGHMVSGSSENDWMTSRFSPQSAQRYS